jgi:hypothetical protein
LTLTSHQLQSVPESLQGTTSKCSN